MKQEILINVSPSETRVAVVENGVLQEVTIEREAKRGLVGNIYRGKVVRVLPGMQSAFIDIGLNKAAFIHAREIFPLQNGETTNTSEDIKNLIREGQDIIVQVLKDMIGSKGARLTTHISLPSRYLVYMPDNNHIGISQRIDEEEERDRLKEIVNQYREKNDVINGGFILRTAADGVTETEIIKDIEFVTKLWNMVESRVISEKVSGIIYESLPLIISTVRDLAEGSVEKVQIDSQESFDKAMTFTEQFVPKIKSIIQHYNGERPIFDLYSVEEEIQKALDRKIGLKSGGYLIFDQTEAMTTIDVNTGAYVGHRNLEETIFKTNLEAAHAIARQIRLRNLGGIIIIDFIDMDDEEHKRQVLRALEKMLDRDYVKHNITGVSELGLVQMTRKRTSESLERVLSETCPGCQGRGAIKTAETICYEIFREIMRAARAYEAEKIMVIASQSVVDRLLDEESSSVADLEEFLHRIIQFQVESLYSQEQFDVVFV